MIIVYVLQSLSENYRYIGITNNLPRRLRQHNSGKNTSTKVHKPYQITLQETFPDYKQARAREIFLKSGQGRKFLDSSI